MTATGRHFAAFTFVDRIAELQPGRHARGEFLIPPGIASFPASLVAEAVGQLAAWVSIAHLGFRVRPVAALAFETRFLGTAAPGDTLELSVDIDSCEDDAVAYQGRARVRDAGVIELGDCVGPMLPLEDFDDASAMRAFFDRLCHGGATPGRFPGVEVPPVAITEHAPAKAARGDLRVPAAAPFFEDHFPRRAVFPATLLLDAQMRLAAGVAREAAEGAAVRASRITDVKLRAFIEPGATLALGAEVKERREQDVLTLVTAAMNGRVIGRAHIEFAAGGAA